MSTSGKTYPTMLTIAGSDSVGGAGIQADIKTATALGVYAMSAITAITAQNTHGVRSFVATSPEMVSGQLHAVLDDVRPDAVKIGMLPDAETVRLVADILRRYELRHIVVDPVLVATSGDALSHEGVPQAMVQALFPLAEIVTPNIPELRTLTGADNADHDFQAMAHRLIATSGCGAVLIKGGHLGGDECTDSIVRASVPAVSVTSPRIDTPNTHGTGCTLSSAIASHLPLGFGLDEAVRRAHAYLARAIADGAQYVIGHGHGPVNHMWKTTNSL